MGKPDPVGGEDKPSINKGSGAGVGEDKPSINNTSYIILYLDDQQIILWYRMPKMIRKLTEGSK